MSAYLLACLLEGLQQTWRHVAMRVWEGLPEAPAGARQISGVKAASFRFLLVQPLLASLVAFVFVLLPSFGHHNSSMKNHRLLPSFGKNKNCPTVSNNSKFAKTDFCFLYKFHNSFFVFCIFVFLGFCNFIRNEHL